MSERNLYKLHADICRTLGNPKRLEIIDTLRRRELTVTELAAALEISQSNLSQHLALMRQQGILVARREGLNAFYSLSNPKILQACELMREVLADHLESDAKSARRESSTEENEA